MSLWHLLRRRRDIAVTTVLHIRGEEVARAVTRAQQRAQRRKREGSVMTPYRERLTAGDYQDKPSTDTKTASTTKPKRTTTRTSTRTQATKSK